MRIKTVFDKVTRDELLERIGFITESSKSKWGKMNAYQMTRHCTIWNEWVLGNGNMVYRQEWLGKIFGKLALKSNTKDEKPIGKNMPAGKAFIVTELAGDLEAEKAIWIAQVKAFEHFSNEDFIHDFFGKMSIYQIGVFAYKHNDHHLRQFNA